LSKNARYLSSFLLVLSIAVTTDRARAEETEGPFDPEAPREHQSIEQLAASAAAAFHSGDFEAAASSYRRALPLVTRSTDAAMLHMNLAACLIELHQLDQAKSEFLKAAEVEPSSASKARLGAALVAFELDRLDEAEALLQSAFPVGETLSSRARDLQNRIMERRRSERREELKVQMSVAAKAIAKDDWARANSALLEAQKLFDVAEPIERVDVLHSLGVVQLAQRHPQEARATLGTAVELSPNDPEIHFALGRARQALGENAEARAEFRRALALGLEEPQAQAAQERLDDLDPLGPSEWFGWLLLAGGYDSNPRQSGVATETTLASRGRGGSLYGRAVGELGRTQRISERLELRLFYAGHWLGLQKRRVQDLSLQEHGLFGGAKWAVSDRFTVGLELGPSFSYVGLGSASQFTWDLVISAEASYLASAVRRWSLDVDVRRITGLSGWEYLSGTQLDAELSHRWRYGSGSLRMGLHARYLAIGTRTTAVDATYLPACAGLCDGATYFIPLSYSGIGPTVGGRLDLASRLHLVASTDLDWRRYRDESYIEGVDASRKRRQDLRWSAGVDLRWGLDRHEQVMLVPSYAFIVSSSNVSQSNTDPDHAFDYDDRSFTQHFFELGVEGSF